jgi:multidrug efflux system membrane fusion protein
MRKAWLLVLGGAAMVGGSLYAFQHELSPWAQQNLPPSLAALITSLPLTENAIASAAAEKAASGDKAKEAAKENAASGSRRRGGGSGGPAPVTAAAVIESDMPVVLSAPGTVEPLATVAVKPRVDGQIIEVGFKEGDLVIEGQVLFRLDDRLVKAQIRQAEANIAKDQANLKDAESTLDRRETLFQKRITSEASTETARMTVESLKASIAAGQALLEAQKTQLDYLVIRAPITGRTGSISAKLGAMVRASEAAPLVTINQTKPIAVSFSLPQTDLGALKRALATEALADITVPGANPTKLRGFLHFVDNQVDKQTGTVQAKVSVENLDESLWPGLAVAVDLTVEVKPKMLAVPASAVLPAQQGMISWIIGPDNRVSVRTVTVERIIGQTAFLVDGVSPGERVVTDGQLRLAPGTAVSIQEPSGAPAADTKVDRRGNNRS